MLEPIPEAIAGFGLACVQWDGDRFANETMPMINCDQNNLILWPDPGRHIDTTIQMMSKSGNPHRSPRAAFIRRQFYERRRTFRKVWALVILTILIFTSASCSHFGLDQNTAPTNVTVVDGSTITSVRLRNDGGDGEYQLELWGTGSGIIACSAATVQQLGGCPTTAVLVGTYDPVRVTAGYDETLPITRAGVLGFKIKSRSLNTAVWQQTSCYQAAYRGALWLTFRCP